MKKIFSSILIAVIILQLFAPFSVILNNKKIAVENNTAEATSGGAIQLKGYITKTDTTITVYAAVKFETDNWRTSNERVVAIISDKDNKAVEFKDTDGNLVEAMILETHDLTSSTSATVLPTEIKNTIADGTTTKFYKKVFAGLSPETTYNVTIYATHNVTNLWKVAGVIGVTAAAGTLIFLSAGTATPIAITVGASMATGLGVATGQTLNITNDENTQMMDPPSLAVTTNKAGDTENQVAYSDITSVNEAAMLEGLECVITSSKTWGGCIGRILYWGLFKPTSAIFGLSGRLLDISVAYSVKDTSYRSPFITEGWGVVRDFCNMFFIFILLYVAFGTILNLHNVKTKEIIINVIIIGLLINFSLFATQFIIDVSNILTRVFYNSETIAIGPKVNGVVKNQLGSQKEIKLSEALVAKINPQSLIMNASKANNIQTKNTISSNEETGVTATTFILVTVLSSIINIVGLITFLTCALLFIFRVVGLWLAMILVPLAFFSYTVPALEDLDMIGWKHWWPETLKLAFMGPIFMFFMYLIVKFLSTTGLALTITNEKSGLDFILGIFVPFIFIMVLLTKAKDVTKKMSGEVGKMGMEYASSIGKAALSVGGLAAGGALGVGAGLLRGTVGSVGNKLATSEWAKTHGAIGRGAQDIGKWASTSSFDLRATKLGASAQKKMGVDLGKAKEGGYAKHKEEVIAKRRQRAEDLKLGINSDQVQNLHTAEEQFSNLKNQSTNDMNRIDGTLTAKRTRANDLSQELRSANDKLAKNPADETAQEEARIAQEEFDKNKKIIEDLVQERVELRTATGRYADRTADGKVNAEEYDTLEKNATGTKGKYDELVKNAPEKIKNAEEKAKSDIAVAESKLETKRRITANAQRVVSSGQGTEKDIENLAKAKEDESAAEAEVNNIKTKSTEIVSNIEKEVEDAKNKAENAKQVFDKIDAIKKVKGLSGKEVLSLDQLELKTIPHLHHLMEEENAARINKYAKTIRKRLFNGEANDNAAHEMIMRSEIKK